MQSPDYRLLRLNPVRNHELSNLPSEGYFIPSSLILSRHQAGIDAVDAVEGTRLLTRFIGLIGIYRLSPSAKHLFPICPTPCNKAGYMYDS